MSDWDDLSDDELRTRLIQRGVAPEQAEHAVADREHPNMAEAIDRILG